MLKSIGIVALLFLAVSSLNLSGKEGGVTHDGLDFLGKKVYIKNKKSQAYLDGRSTSGSPVYLTNKSPAVESNLQWVIEESLSDKDIYKEIYTIRSVSSKCWLDGRNYSGQTLLMSWKRMPDRWIYWKIIPSD